MSVKKINIWTDNKEIWINPIGGYGDILMLSGILKKCIDENPALTFCLVRRSIYASLLNGHPAIKRIGHPPKNAHIITSDYWLKEKLGVKNQRPYQILARLFGFRTPVEENLYLPMEHDDDDRLLQDLIPYDSSKIAIIAPSSNSPRKMMEPSTWQNFAEGLKNKGIFVIQVGLKDDIYIKGAYSLLGLTTPRQLISMLTKSNVIISIDNFIVHAAHLTGKPAIIIWGPTNSEIYGYPEHINIQCSTNHCKQRNKCLGPDFPDNCKTPCPVKNKHCMSKIPVDKIIEIVINICFP
jgi:ADP-heptose:LPS heptosyltransferase